MEPLNLAGDLRTRGAHVLELLSEARQDNALRVRVDDHDRLLRGRTQDLSGEALAHARRELQEQVAQVGRGAWRDLPARDGVAEDQRPRG